MLSTSFDRSELWPTLLAKFPNLVAYIVLTYGDAAPVFFKEGESLTTILNCVGSRQGCALGSYLFAIALHPILQWLRNFLRYLCQRTATTHTSPVPLLMLWLPSAATLS